MVKQRQATAPKSAVAIATSVTVQLIVKRYCGMVQPSSSKASWSITGGLSMTT